MIWPIVALLAAAAAFLLARHLYRQPPREEPDPNVVAELENLKSVNALLRTLTSTHDITRSLFELALRIRAIVPCDRVGLAMLTDDGEGYNTYTARIDASGSASGPRPDLHFPRRSTLIDEVVTAREARVVNDVSSLAPTCLDANVIRSAGFVSVIVVPLVFEGDALGTLNLVSRRPGAFTDADVQALRPVAESIATAYGTRKLANALARHQMSNELSELTFAFANDMSGAVQAIIGQCELLARTYPDPSIGPELAGMLQQARRLRDILNQMQRMAREQTIGMPARPQ